MSDVDTVEEPLTPLTPIPNFSKPLAANMARITLSQLDILTTQAVKVEYTKTEVVKKQSYITLAILLAI